VVELLKEKEVGEILIFAGGIIPKEDIPVLEEMGIQGIFTPGTPTAAIVDWLHQRLEGRKAAS
jgi:methylmalonyl-CoA mutase, C-terminal domain